MPSKHAYLFSLRYVEIAQIVIIGRSKISGACYTTLATENKLVYNWYELNLGLPHQT